MDQIISLMSRSRVAALLIKDWLSLMEEHRVEDCFVAALMHNVPACAFRAETGVDKSFADLDVLARQAGFLDYKQMIERFIESQRLSDLLLDLLTTPPGFDRRRLLLKSAIEVANMLEQGWWRIELVEKSSAWLTCWPRPFETIWHDMLQLVLNVARNPHVPGYGLGRQLAAMPELEQPLSQSFLNLSIQWDPASSSEPPAEFDQALNWVVSFWPRTWRKSG